MNKPSCNTTSVEGRNPSLEGWTEQDLRAVAVPSGIDVKRKGGTIACVLPAGVFLLSLAEAQSFAESLWRLASPRPETSADELHA